jgi:hypothetical protein
MMQRLTATASFKVSCFASAILLVCLVLKTSFVFGTDENGVRPVVWGGGGAFTSIAGLKDDLYLSSDLSGVWKQVNGHWQPYIKGLLNYNVTSLVAFGDRLLAITTNEIFYTNGDGQ